MMIFFEKTSKEMNWLFYLEPVSSAILQQIFNCQIFFTVNFLVKINYF